MGGKSSSSGSSSMSQTYTPAALSQIQNLYSQILGTSQIPYTPYPNPLVAPLSGTQQSGISNINNTVNSGGAQPYIDAAAQYAIAGANPISPNAIQYYENPFTQQVVDTTLSNINRNNQLQQQQLQGNATSQHALGGDRLGVAQAELARNQDLATNQTLAGLGLQGYSSALSAAQNDAQRMGQTAYTLGNLGLTSQGAQLAGAQAQLGAGAQQQQTQQQQLAAAYGQFLQSQGYPFQTTSYLASLGLPALTAQGGTTTGTGSSSSSGSSSSFGGALGILGGLFGADGGRVPSYALGGGTPYGGGDNYVSGSSPFYQSWGQSPWASVDDYSKGWVPMMGPPQVNTQPPSLSGMNSGSSGGQSQGSSGGSGGGKMPSFKKMFGGSGQSNATDQWGNQVGDNSQNPYGGSGPGTTGGIDWQNFAPDASLLTSSLDPTMMGGDFGDFGTMDFARDGGRQYASGGSTPFSVDSLIQTAHKIKHGLRKMPRHYDEGGSVDDEGDYGTPDYWRPFVANQVRQGFQDLNDSGKVPGFRDSGDPTSSNFALGAWDRMAGNKMPPVDELASRAGVGLLYDLVRKPDAPMRTNANQSSAPGQSYIPNSPPAAPLSTASPPPAMPPVAPAGNPFGQPAQSEMDIRYPQHTQLEAAADDILKFNGMTMHNPQQREMLLDYMATGGQNLSREQRAWCADMVSAALRHQGVRGTDSAAAPSYLNWGRNVTDPFEVSKGMVAVFNRPSRQGYHVGLINGNATQDANGNWVVPVVSGNAGNSSVRNVNVPLSQLSVRTPSDDSSPNMIARNMTADNDATSDGGSNVASPFSYQSSQPSGISEAERALFRKASGEELRPAFPGDEPGQRTYVQPSFINSSSNGEPSERQAFLSQPQPNYQQNAEMSAQQFLRNIYNQPAHSNRTGLLSRMFEGNAPTRAQQIQAATNEMHYDEARKQQAREKYTWYPGTGKDANGETVSGMYRLPTQGGGDKPEFFPGQTITGRATGRSQRTDDELRRSAVSQAQREADANFSLMGKPSDREAFVRKRTEQLFQYARTGQWDTNSPAPPSNVMPGAQKTISSKDEYRAWAPTQEPGTLFTRPDGSRWKVGPLPNREAIPVQ